MNSKIKSIVLVDQHLDMNSDWFEKVGFQKSDLVLLDPVNLFSELDWTCYEEDVRVINKIYSHLFEEVVMNNKKLVCFWPLAQQLGEEWFNLSSLCKANSFELELYKSKSLEDLTYGFNFEILSSWKSFIHFLIESLFEDIRLNEQFDEIATLKSEQETIILFKLVQDGTIRYSYAFDSDFLELIPNQGEYADKDELQFQSFESFNEMLEKLLKESDLSLFESRFVDGSLEKAYFSILSKEFKTKNLIENWLMTYSMN